MADRWHSAIKTAAPSAVNVTRDKNNTINLRELPSEVQEKLKALDIDGDGMLNVSELGAFHTQSEKTLNKARVGPAPPGSARQRQHCSGGAARATCR